MKTIGLLTILSLLIMGTQPNCDDLEGDDMYYVIEDNKLKQADKQDAEHFYVKGHYEGDHFVVDGQLMGDAPLATEGTPGWFELSSQHFYSQQTAQPPISPYVIGYKTPKGFVPSKKNIY
ncbi:MAG: hypothetical protein WCK42_01725 [Myxococcaceae bacterium]